MVAHRTRLNFAPVLHVVAGLYSSTLPKAKEGIKRKIARGADQSEVFEAVVSVQRQLILFHERKEAMQLLMDRSLAVLAHLRQEEIQVRYCCCNPKMCYLLFVRPSSTTSTASTLAV